MNVSAKIESPRDTKQYTLIEPLFHAAGVVRHQIRGRGG